MQDRQVFEQILGIVSPWFVSQVELALKEGEVRVALAHRPDAVWRCPECGQVCPLHDHQEERRWRHLDTCQYRTVMSASLPRTNCAEHGVKVVRVPWAEPLSRFTLLFEGLVIAWLGEASQSAVAEQFGLSWDEVHGIMDRAVELQAAGDERLKGTKYDWLRNCDHFDRVAWREFQVLKATNLKTSRAWAIRQQALALWEYSSETWARKHFRQWYYWATHSRLKPMIETAKMLQRRVNNVLSYLKHRITNAVSEGLNSKIQWVKYTARGYRNFDNFTTAIYFHCGGLDLKPSH